MPSQPPRAEPVKKKEILAKRERELRHALIRYDATHAKVHKAAENVRSAKLKVFKGKIAQLRYEDTRWKGDNNAWWQSKNSEDDTTRGAKALREQKRWQELSVEEIILIYQQSDA